MNDQEERLTGCFLSVFPDLATNEIAQASSTTVQSWDSVANVTLLAVVEEEFGINIEVDDLAKFDSFKGILSYLQETGQHVKSLTDGA
jgi:acyl carrier protein